ncbi:hypothetical protein BDF20DRAFT_292076 [Mycotypha africana]|uniref:uncharacterized protein n=1 Tax=Mycotypha africana TaxID=64632 RepID=UPI002300CDCE|nr:uncharacterized protein BDF20DRAFT_292076 [Mycotypha africana]KAI8987843.1 hypothetical protein BDF20DRAFT_292076 [Mycotypha africana]
MRTKSGEMFNSDSVLDTLVVSTNGSTSHISRKKELGQQIKNYTTSVCFSFFIIYKTSFFNLHHPLFIMSDKNTIPLYSGKYFLASALAGILACGPTHSLVTPLDLVKCRNQVSAHIHNISYCLSFCIERCP